MISKSRENVEFTKDSVPYTTEQATHVLWIHLILGGNTLHHTKTGLALK
jgi:hypothetical protein